MNRAWILCVLPLIAGGCVRSYVSRAPHSATVGRTSLELDSVVTAPGSAIYPPAGAVVVRGHYSAAPGETLAAPQLARPSSAPCEDGVPARIASSSSDKDTLTALFRRDAIDEHSLLSNEPTMFDVIVVRGLSGHPECLRVPLVVNPTRPEWSQTPRASFGYAFSLFVPFRRIYAADAAPMLTLRGGPFVGPVRLRAELGVGGAFEKNRNANLVAYSYRAGLLVDSLLLHTERFGLGVGAGYDLTGLTLSANVNALSHDGAGYQGLIYGPRAGIAFALLPQAPIGQAFVARPDAASATLELYMGAESSHDHANPTPAFWLALATDVGL
jgi:hypothetical protein